MTLSVAKSSLAQRFLGDLTTEEFAQSCASSALVVLVPVGSVEPHGPHLPLTTDTLISETAAARALYLLRESGVETYIAPSVSYGVTNYASGFKGAVSIPAALLTELLSTIANRLLADGVAHVCFVNNHLEPEHDAAVRAAVGLIESGRASSACPLTKRWARTLSDEFKEGSCHAGRYETSLVFAAGAEVRGAYLDLPELRVSLATEIRAGKTTFSEMGLDRAYTGSPSRATREEGLSLFDRLAEMIATEVTEALATLNLRPEREEP